MLLKRNIEIEKKSSKNDYWLRHISLSTYISASPNGQIFVNFHSRFLRKSVDKRQILLKPNKNIGHFKT
jgi:hypothetical protein